MSTDTKTESPHHEGEGLPEGGLNINNNHSSERNQMNNNNTTSIAHLPGSGPRRVILPESAAQYAESMFPRVVRPLNKAAVLYLQDDSDEWTPWVRYLLPKRTHVKHKGQTWTVATHHTKRLLAGLVNAYGSALFIHAERLPGERCDTRCAEASAETAHDCECKCFGSLHGYSDGSMINPDGTTFLYKPGVIGYYGELWGDISKFDNLLITDEKSAA